MGRNIRNKRTGEIEYPNGCTNSGYICITAFVGLLMLALPFLHFLYFSDELPAGPLLLPAPCVLLSRDSRPVAGPSPVTLCVSVWPPAPLGWLGCAARRRPPEHAEGAS
jgi:hypothetical protein